MKFYIASDHAGFGMKGRILRYLAEKHIEAVDMGAYNGDSVDYPDYAVAGAGAVSKDQDARGILICGTGIGMSIVANRLPGIRAALCHDVTTAAVSRRHNDANILVLGSRILDEETALRILEVWLETKFDGGRHQRRIDKIKEIEQRRNI